MSSRYKIHDDYKPHFITSTVVRWIDALSRPVYKDIIVDSLRFSIENKGLRLYSWVIMSNHFHIIASAEDNHSLAGTIRDIKKFTSNKLLKAIATNPQESRREWMMKVFEYDGSHNNSNERFQFWQQGLHPIELSTDAMFFERFNYVHENPVKAGLVRQPQDYVYSSAIDHYENRKGLLSLREF